MLNVRARRWTFVLAALAALFVASLSVASARTFHHGMSVWFSDESIGSGDDVAGDVDIYFGNVTCSDGGHIEGNVRKFFGSFDADDDCTVDGRVTDAFDESALVPAVPWIDRLNDDFSAQNRAFFKKLGWDAVVIFAFLLFPVRVRVGLDRVERHPGLSAAAGVIAVIAALPVAVMLLITVIGIPLIVLEFAALLACLWIGWAAVALVLGRRLLELARPHTTPSPLAALVAGLVLVTAAQTLPLVGWAVTALMTFVALGSALLAFVREAAFATFTGHPSTLPPAGPPMNRPA
ncbi:MAG: hypothetical protein IAI48_09845 [Candidatus Eremiobacteraeota bacterium]|nr:hypothetical protein [Candidatus Eremiobacteraeota bacterium]